MSYLNKNLMIKYLTKKNGVFCEEYYNMTMMQSFKQFFTPQKYSQYLIDELSYLNPNRVIDLAVGGGSLLKEAIEKWGNAKYFGNDIDETCCRKIASVYSNIQCFNHDIFKYSTIDELIPDTQPIDLCLGNPPFDLIKQNFDTKNVLELFHLEKIYTSNKIPAELIFILQCLRIVSEQGTIALILPNGFFVNSYLKRFREFLVDNYNIEKIVELPDNIFIKTEAKTHILIFKKEPPTNSHITLSSIDSKSNLVVSKEDAIHRMDYSYYANSLENINSMSISDLGVEVLRGKPKYKLTDIDAKHIIHTTSFAQSDIFVNQLRSGKQLSKYKDRLAMPGDIIFARVGTYCLGNIGIVEKGYFVATDCVFVIRTEDPKLRNKIFNSLKSVSGQNWIKAHSKGVAARHITLEDIKKFPVNRKSAHEF
jgi:type I restriction enzyme M protein